MKVINLYGGPGTGKSTAAAGLFHKMKTAGAKVELITEYAKDKVYQESFFLLKDQLYIFTKQHHKLWRLKDKVDYAIVDSPLLLSLHYFQPNEIYDEDLFKKFVLSTFNAYDNINIFLLRDTDIHPYQNYGRMQTEAEAKIIDKKIKSLLEYNNIKYTNQKIHDGMLDDIVKIINY